MNKLKENITNLFGEKGKSWLINLPAIVETLASYWELTSLIPVDNMTFNYVAKARFKNQPVVLKISCDKKSITEEKNALNYFDGHGSINLIDYNHQYNALLLQQALPGTTLKSFYPNKIKFVINNYITTMCKLHDRPIPVKHSFAHISDWLKAIDKVSSNKIPQHLLHRAIYLKNELLSFPSRQIVLHGDLHHDNILKHGDDWLAIDPKGVVGEAEFDVAAFDFIHSTELENAQDIRNLFNTRARLIATKANLNLQHIKNWAFVRLILAAAWSIEDNCDPSWDIKLANLIIS